MSVCPDYTSEGLLFVSANTHRHPHTLEIGKYTGSKGETVESHKPLIMRAANATRVRVA